MGRVAVWLAKCQMWKKSQNEASRDSAMRGVPLHVHYIHFDQNTYISVSTLTPWAVTGPIDSCRVNILLIDSLVLIFRCNYFRSGPYSPSQSPTSCYSGTPPSWCPSPQGYMCSPDTDVTYGYQSPAGSVVMNNNQNGSHGYPATPTQYFGPPTPLIPTTAMSVPNSSEPRPPVFTSVHGFRSVPPYGQQFMSATPQIPPTVVGVPLGSMQSHVAHCNSFGYSNMDANQQMSTSLGGLPANSVASLPVSTAVQGFNRLPVHYPHVGFNTMPAKQPIPSTMYTSLLPLPATWSGVFNTPPGPMPCSTISNTSPVPTSGSSASNTPMASPGASTAPMAPTDASDTPTTPMAYPGASTAPMAPTDASNTPTTPMAYPGASTAPMVSTGVSNTPTTPMASPGPSTAPMVSTDASNTPTTPMASPGASNTPTAPIASPGPSMASPGASNTPTTPIASSDISNTTPTSATQLPAALCGDVYNGENDQDTINNTYNSDTLEHSGIAKATKGQTSPGDNDEIQSPKYDHLAAEHDDESSIISSDNRDIGYTNSTYHFKSGSSRPKTNPTSSECHNRKQSPKSDPSSFKYDKDFPSLSSARDNVNDRSYRETVKSGSDIPEIQSPEFQHEDQDKKANSPISSDEPGSISTNPESEDER